MKKIINIFIISLFITALIWSQDFSFDSSDNNSEFSDDSFIDSGDSSFFSGDTGGLEISGSLDIPVTMKPKWDSLENSTWSFSPELITNLDYSNGKTDLRVILNTKMNEGETSINLNEAWVRLYMGNIDLEVGMMKIIWGKGDKVHVMDTLNPMDYSQFIEPDYNKRKQADLMVRLNLTTGDSGRTEIIFLPWFTPDTYAEEGSWLMADTAVMKTAGETALETFGPLYYLDLTGGGLNDGLAALATAQKISEMESNFMRIENTQTLKHAQGGIRYTSTIKSLDWGAAVIRSFVREPVVKGIDLSLITAASDPHFELSYTPMIMAAQEAALIVNGFNFKEEAALTLTKDWDGSDPDLRNSKAEWLFGFDLNLPLNNFNINLQSKGSYLLFTDKITAYDPEYSDRYYNHMIIASLSDSYFHDTLKLSFSGSWNVEDHDYMFIPELEMTFRESAAFTLAYNLYEGASESLFGQFDDQDNITLSCRMNF